MTKTVLLSYNVRPGTNLDEFDAFMREHDYPTFRSHPKVKSYTSFRVTQDVQGSVNFTHFDLLEVEDFADFGDIMGDPTVGAHAVNWITRWSEHGLEASPELNFRVQFCEEI